MDGVVLLRFYKDGACVSSSYMKCYKFRNNLETFDVRKYDEITLEYGNNYESITSADSFESSLDTTSSESDDEETNIEVEVEGVTE